MPRKKPAEDQLDLFVTYLTDLPLRDQRDTMERPFFSLSKGRRSKPIEYVTGDTSVKISAPAHLGIATVWDADILIWAASQINEAREHGGDHSRRLKFQPYDLLRAIHRGTSGRDYDQLRKALKRLAATVVETNIRIPDGGRAAVFHWLERIEELTSEDGQPKGIEITLPTWLYEGIVQGRVLSIAPGYFRITSGLSRWLYRVVRKHAGRQQGGWNCTFRTLHEKSGSTQRLTDFIRDMRKIIEADALPEYHLEVYQGERGDVCLHAVRRSLLPSDHPATDRNILEGKKRTRPTV